VQEGPAMIVVASGNDETDVWFSVHVMFQRLRPCRNVYIRRERDRPVSIAREFM